VAESGGQSNALVDELTKERDELKGRLQEYEIIEDDLANLKKLQQENEELKKQLAGKGGSPPTASAPPPPPPPPPKVEEAKPAAPAAAPAEISGEEKSAEDLLSEFEKMLG